MANFICKVFDQLTGKLVVSVQKQFTTQQDARESLPQIVTEIKGLEDGEYYADLYNEQGKSVPAPRYSLISKNGVVTIN